VSKTLTNKKKVKNCIKLFVVSKLKTFYKNMNFQNKINEKNEFFEFLSKDRFLGLDKNNFLWPGNEDKLLAVIKTLPISDSSESLVSFISFWNSDFHLADEETLRFFEDLKKINYNNLTTSALFSYLKIKYHQNNNFLNYYDWKYVVSILVNPKISTIVLDFLIKMNIPYFLKITQTEDDFMQAVRLHFYFINSLNNYSWDLRGFYNLLKFLKIEKSIINSLLEETMNQKSFKEIQAFVSKYNLNFD